MSSQIITLGKKRKMKKNRPKTEYLWKGLKQKSFGLVYGPPKSGKTIFCENLAYAICLGEKDFLNSELKPLNNKVLFLSLEEYWENSMDRQEIQLERFTEEQVAIIEENFLTQNIDFHSVIQSPEQWSSLESLIIESKAKTVFIDSITRMNHGKLEESKTAEEIMQRLRSLAAKHEINLFCIHHTFKIRDEELTMYNIKGSTVFSQESDFVLGINCTSKGNRYLKEVFYRYASYDFETVSEIEIDDNLHFNILDDVNEIEILKRTDRRRLDNKENKIVYLFNKYKTKEYSLADVKVFLSKNLGIRGRMIENYLSKLVSEGKILNTKRGYYASISYNSKINNNAA